MADASALVARNVRRIRQERQLSLGRLARQAGLAKQTLSTIERGTGNPTVDTLHALARALGVGVTWLLTEWGTPVFVQRAADAAWDDGDGRPSRLLDQIYGSGHVRTALLHVPPGPGDRPVDPHSPGTLHHVYVIEGSLVTGPIEDPVELGRGDFARFPGDVPHTFGNGGTERAVVHMVTTIPQVPNFVA